MTEGIGNKKTKYGIIEWFQEKMVYNLWPWALVFILLIVLTISVSCLWPGESVDSVELWRRAMIIFISLSIPTLFIKFLFHRRAFLREIRDYRETVFAYLVLALLACSSLMWALSKDIVSGGLQYCLIVGTTLFAYVAYITLDASREATMMGIRPYVLIQQPTAQQDNAVLVNLGRTPAFHVSIHPTEMDVERPDRLSKEVRKKHRVAEVIIPDESVNIEAKEILGLIPGKTPKEVQRFYARLVYSDYEGNVFDSGFLFSLNLPSR